MALRVSKYNIELCFGGACGNAEKAAERNDGLAKARKDFEKEHGRPPKPGEFNKWLCEEI